MTYRICKYGTCRDQGHNPVSMGTHEDFFCTAHWTESLEERISELEIELNRVREQRDDFAIEFEQRSKK